MNKQDNLIHHIINEPYKLYDDQTEVVISENKYLKIIAGAGAEKTEKLSRKIIYL